MLVVKGCPYVCLVIETTLCKAWVLLTVDFRASGDLDGDDATTARGSCPSDSGETAVAYDRAEYVTCDGLAFVIGETGMGGGWTEGGEKEGGRRETWLGGGPGVMCETGDKIRGGGVIDGDIEWVALGGERVGRYAVEGVAGVVVGGAGDGLCNNGILGSAVEAKGHRNWYNGLGGDEGKEENPI